ncbi:hypothetical protein TrVE_jg343 [Triparma verrucosa]|uniref:Uncharacterized protein n=1 Tax=Triparma verrucosa TaxID=1606542 RepID=A0A9W7C5Q8_9STRA|nr:hypothetical protein TrVE_jg343 [Triparma verrucosa]
MANPLNQTSMSSINVEMTSMDRNSEPAKGPDFRMADPSCLGSADVCKCCPSKAQMKDEALYNRMTMCFFAITLMWCTSLKVAAELASAYIPTPTVDSVMSSCTNAYDIVNEEREEYLQCVEIQLGQCNINLAQAADDEADRIDVAYNANRQLLEDAKAVQNSCSSAYSNGRFSLESWASNGVALPYLAGCSDSDKEKIEDAVGDISAVRSEAFTLSSEYSDESQSTVDRLADYMVLRAAYDSQYADNRTQHMQDKFENWVENIYLPSIDLNTTFEELFPDIDTLVSCVSVRDPANGTCPFMENAYKLIDNGMKDLTAMVDIASQRTKDLRDSAAEYQDNAWAAYRKSKEFYDGLHQTVGRLSLSTGDWGDWYHIPLEDMYPLDVNFPDAIEFENLPSIDGVWEKVAPALESMYVNMTDAQIAAYNMGMQWKRDVQEQLDKLPDPLPEDYNPPQYESPDPAITNVTAEKKAHQEKSNKFRDQTAVALDAFAELSQYSEDNFNPPSVTFNFTAMADKASNFEFNFEKLRGSAIDFELWFIQFGSLSDMLIYGDLIFRAYQTVRMLYYYWGRGALNVPDVDVTCDKEPSNPFRLSTPRLTALVISNPMTPAFIAMIFTIWGSALLSSIYEPLYQEYISGCLQGGENGTFVTENLFSISYNYASQDGNSATFAGLDAYDVQRAELCSQYGANSVNRQNEDAGVLASLKESHSTAANGLNLYTSCIDTSSLDGQFQDSCCGQTGYGACTGSGGEGVYNCPINELVEPQKPWSQPSEYLLEDSCQMAMVGDDWELQDSVYNCDYLPTCDLTCGGPARIRMERSTESCGCHLEWGGHSIWLQLVVAFVMYTLLNLARIKFIQGLSKIFWKYLHPGLFTFKATCLRDGEIVVSEEFTVNENEEIVRVEEGEHEQHSILYGGTGDTKTDRQFKKVLEEELGVILPKYRRKGFVQVFMAICLNVPWIYLLKNVSYNIRYEG